MAWRHDRTPVLLPAESDAEWLAPRTPQERLLGLLAPYPAELMIAAGASPLVNDPKHDGPECLAAA